jgi:hypothetical protein
MYVQPAATEPPRRRSVGAGAPDAEGSGMKSFPTRVVARRGLVAPLAVIVAFVALAAPARAQELEPLTAVPATPPTVTATATPEPAPTDDHATPRVQLTLERFSLGNVDGSSVPLEALHLDLYPLSWRWLRAGLEVEAGRGHAAYDGARVDLRYGLLGINGGLQWPGRITPFVEGRLAGGVLAGSLDGSVAIPGTTVSVSGVSTATWMVARGIDAGVDVYTFGRTYLTASLGWVRTTWGEADYEAMLANLSAGLQFRDVTHDSFLFKLGLGF